MNEMPMTLVANAPLAGIASHVARAAREDFVFFVRHVLGLDLSPEVCRYIQDLLAEREDGVITTRMPRSIGSAVHAWLATQGVEVISSFPALRCETLLWVEMSHDTPPAGGVILSPHPEGVEVVWVRQ